MGNLLRLAKEHFGGLLLLAIVLIGSNMAVRIWKSRHPGAMSVLESQAMDMTTMKPPVGAVPVATEIVHLGRFEAKVTYTGSVAPLQEQVIYPRVEGWLTNLNVYDGDSIRQGQLIAVIDSPDLRNKVLEASASRAVAASAVPVARFNAARMQAEKAAAQAEVQAAKNDLARAKAILAAYEKIVIQRQKEVKSARANLDYWKSEIKREENLFKAGAVSRQEYEAEKAQYIAAEAELENKEAMLEEAEANVLAAKSEIAAKQSMVYVASERAAAASAAFYAARSEIGAKSAMVNQAEVMTATAAIIDSYRYIRAPFAGRIARRYVSPGQFVTPATAITNIVQIDRVRLQANVADKDIGRIRVGAPVTARFSKDPRLIVNAKVTSISPLTDQASRTAVVEAVGPNPGGRIQPGDAVTMEITVSSYAESISVPVSAIVRKDGQTAVWIARNEAAKGKRIYYCTMHPEVTSDKPGECPKCFMKLVPKTSKGRKKAHLVIVTTGLTGGDRIQVLRGLSDGDEVIYKGNTYLKEGDIIFPTEWTADGPRKMPKAPGANEMPSTPGMDHSGRKMNMNTTAVIDNNSEFSHFKTESQKSQKASGKRIYQCPMHPHEMSHNPNARCRKCGMNLEEKK